MQSPIHQRESEETQITAVGIHNKSIRKYKRDKLWASQVTKRKSGRDSKTQRQTLWASHSTKSKGGLSGAWGPPQVVEHIANSQNQTKVAALHRAPTNSMLRTRRSFFFLAQRVATVRTDRPSTERVCPRFFSLALALSLFALRASCCPSVPRALPLWRPPSADGQVPPRRRWCWWRAHCVRSQHSENDNQRRPSRRRTRL